MVLGIFVVFSFACSFVFAVCFRLCARSDFVFVFVVFSFACSFVCSCVFSFVFSLCYRLCVRL